MTFNQSYKYKYKQGNIYQSMFLWPELYIRNVMLIISWGKKNTIASSLLVMSRLVIEQIIITSVFHKYF